MTWKTNTSDHIACGRANMDAVRDAGNRWIFPEQISDEGLARQIGTRLGVPMAVGLEVHDLGGG